jgi:hypothetical protein
MGKIYDTFLVSATEQAAKHVLQYLNSTLNLCITYGPCPQPNIPLGYTDASHAADFRRPQIAFRIPFLPKWRCNLAILRRQSIMALSSVEAEYIGTTNAAQETILLQKLISSVTGKSLEGLTIILTDSEAALNHPKNVNHARTKHIDTPFHYICDKPCQRQECLSQRPTLDVILGVVDMDSKG